MEEKKIIVSLRNISKSYGGSEAKVVKNINLDIYEGEFLTILGASGCGKTTTLRMIAGFENVTSGEIYIEGNLINDVPPYKREVNTAFQSYALFPHLNIYDNIAYGLRVKRVPKNEIKERVMRMLELVRLEGYEKRKPAQLSGGQKQRVSIARALINNPKVLLLDEPLGALDLNLRKQMQLELKSMQKKLGITFIYITHDQEEALTMSDRIAVMHNGVLEQVSKPKELYLKPQTKYVAEFIGESNIFEGIVQAQKDGLCTVNVESGYITCQGNGYQPGEMVYVCIRPEKMKIYRKPVEEFSIKGEIKENIFTGNIVKTIVSLPNGHDIIVSDMGNTDEYQEGDVIYLGWDSGNAVVIRNPVMKINDKLGTLQEVIKNG